MRNILKNIVLLSAVFFLSAEHGFAKNITLKLTHNSGAIECAYEHGYSDVKKITLYRSTTPMDEIPLNIIEYPISVYALSPDGNVYRDNQFADNVTYYYKLEILLKNNKKKYSKTTAITISDKKIGALRNPVIIVDKKNYVLELRSSGSVKKYPVALGQDPVGRKLHQDNSTTPEGFYRITNLRPVATYYKAYDLNYPNKIDRYRYDFYKKHKLMSRRGNGSYPRIGGSIQIHGKGIYNNWTWGCIAMRNADIDELFGLSTIKKKTKVVILGENLTRQDVKLIENVSISQISKIQEKLKDKKIYTGRADGLLGRYTRNSIALYQYNNNLPVTFEIDSRVITLLD